MKFCFKYGEKEVLITDGDEQITIGSPERIIITISKKNIYTQAKEQLFIVSEEILKGHLKYLKDVRLSHTGIELEEINLMIKAVSEILEERNA